MKSAYDDLSQESWDSACDNMPQDYLDGVLTEIKKAQPLSRYKPLSVEERNKLYHQWKRKTILECYGRDIGAYAKK